MVYLLIEVSKLQTEIFSANTETKYVVLFQEMQKGSLLVTIHNELGIELQMRP